jgi:hypothetical protein
MGGRRRDASQLIGAGSSELTPELFNLPKLIVTPRDLSRVA